jgi:3',5'-cyclic AMP phosphodiesterase CpdA
MTRLFHVSDLHFGAEDRAALDWFAATVATEKPDAVVITGDLTMRARHREFAAAEAWIGALPAPVTIEVGNHDLPYFNLFERFVRPYRRYGALERRLERTLALDGVAVVPLKTTARAQLRLDWSKGAVRRGAVATAVEAMAAVPAGWCRIVACHHPLVDADTRTSGSTRGGRRALETLAAAGAGIILSGHVHDPFDLTAHTPSGPVRIVGAGTLSERIRAHPPSFNELRFAAGSAEVIHRYA